ncbi:MAG TPA: hypothetical protein VG273_10185 [Bryobacteraceae bacterium]|jgi:hypothetical protein|nr:hypothetical protein [Bryobacteraceae bacterium]
MSSDSQKLSATTSGFVLSAAITVLFNTALAWAKDVYPGLNDFMKSVAGHHWTTHGLADLVLFIGLGLAFSGTGAGQKIDPNRLVGALVGAVTIAALGLALWFAFV